MTTTPETIAAASGFVRAEVALRSAARAVRTAISDLIGVDPDDADGVLVPMRQAAAQTLETRDAARDALAAVHARDCEHRAAVEREDQRHEKALARIAKKYRTAVAK